MQPRINYANVSNGALKAMFGLGEYLHQSGLEKTLLDLIDLRVSQLNGCAYCLDMHWKDLKAAGEPDQKLYSLEAWRETPFYSPKERAALAWAEAVTTLTDKNVPDEIFEEARKHFSEKELVDLTLGVVAINGWNRLNVAFRTVPGSYQPAKVHAKIQEVKTGT
jgi:AhpD family alkylhydroperoxidase